MWEPVFERELVLEFVESNGGWVFFCFVVMSGVKRGEGGGGWG